MANLPVFLFCLACLSAAFTNEVEAKADTGASDYYLLLTLNGNERTVFRPQVDEYGRYVYKGRREASLSKFTG